MSYRQFMFDGAGPGDCEEIVENPYLMCIECEKNNRELDMIRYHLSIVLMHLFDETDDDLSELETSMKSMCRKLDIEFNPHKTLKVQKI